MHMCFCPYGTWEPTWSLGGFANQFWGRAGAVHSRRYGVFLVFLFFFFCLF